MLHTNTILIDPAYKDNLVFLLLIVVVLMLIYTISSFKIYEIRMKKINKAKAIAMLYVKDKGNEN